MHTCMQTSSIQTNIHTRIHACMNTYTYIRTYIHTDIHTYTLSYIHAYIHAYIQEDKADAEAQDLADALDRIVVLARLCEEQKDQISQSRIQREMVLSRGLIPNASQDFPKMF